MANYFLNDDGSLTKNKKKKKGNNYILQDDGKLVLEKSDYNSISTDTSTTINYEDLSKKESDLLKQVNSYDRKLKREWWDSDEGFFDNTGNVLYKLFAEKQDDKYVKDEKYDALVNELNEVKKQREQRKIAEQSEKGISGLDKVAYTIVGNVETAAKGVESTAKKILGQTPEVEDLSYNEKMAQLSRQQTSGAGGVGLDVLGSVSRMLPNMLVGNPTGAMAMGFANYGGGAYNEAIRDGATEEQATKYGLVVGTLEMALEKALGGFESVYGKSALGGVTNRVMGKLISNPALRKAASGMAGEFTEEYLQEFLEPIVKNTILEEENGADFWNTMKDDFGEGLKQLGGQFFNKENAYAGMLGAVTSGVVGAQGNIEAYNYTKKTGRDIDTGLTTNEQSVLDTVKEQRTTEIQKERALNTEIDKQIKEFESTFGTMTEAEKNGIKARIQEKLDKGEIDYTSSKLSKKEIEKIEKEVRTDLEKGNIDIDTIENTLASEKTAQIKELEARMNESTNEQEKAEIQAQISELTNAKNTELKALLSKDTYLQNSYREANLKKEKFFYEPTGYESEYKRSLAKDFEKVANNTTKSHETFEMLSKIAEDKQTNYGVINNEQLKQLGYDIEGKDVNGLVRVNADGTQKVLINIDSNKALNRIVGHETTHLLEGTKEYTELQQMVKEYAETKGDYNRIHKEFTKLYDGIDADIEAEITSELVGDYLFTDTDFINNLSTKKPTIFQKIYNEIKHLYKMATAGSKEARQLEKVKKAFDKAYKQNASNMSETDVKYSVSDNQGRTLTKEQQEYFKDSKVRDKKGKLEIMYRGDTGETINVFDKNKSKKSNLYGTGFYFADENMASLYGNTTPYYLNIVNPLYVNKDTHNITKEQYSKFIKLAMENEDYSFENYGNMSADELINKLYDGRSDFKLINDVVATAMGDYRDAFEVFEKANGIKYDGIISNSQTVVFDSNQIKNIDNTNPTSDEDIRYSLGNEDIAPSRNDIYGSDIKLQVEEAIAPLKEEITQLKEELAPVKDEYRALTEEDIPMLEQQYKEDFKNIDESNMPIEAEDTTPEFEEEITATKSLEDVRDFDAVGSRKVKAYQYENPEVRPYFQEMARYMLGDLENSVKGERGYNDQLYYDTAGEQGFYGTTRQTTDDIAELLDSKYNYTYKDIRKGLEAIIEDHGAENIAVAKRIELILDKRLREGYTDVSGYEIPANEEYLKLMEAKEIDDYYDSLPIDESMIPPEEDIAPVVIASNTKVKENNVPIKEQLKENSVVEEKPSRVEQQTAQILDERPTPKNKDKKLKAIATVNLIDKGYYISKLARQTDNRQLDALWDNTLLSNAQAQEVIGEGRFKFNEDTKSYEKVGDSVYEIFEGLETTDKVKDFNEYMYHKLNIERMSLEDKAQLRMRTLRETALKGYTDEDIDAISRKRLKEDAKQEIIDLVDAAKEYKNLSEVKNKPVFGDSIDANKSIEIVNKIEQNNPEFSDYAKKVYDYESGTYSDLSLLVESGILSQEDANYYRNKYESYVPIMRDTDAGMMENQIFGKRVSVGNVVKSAKGGTQNIIPLKDAMAIKTMLIQRAANMNKLGLELMNALNPTVESESVTTENIIDDINGNKDLLQEGTNGKAPTMTVYEHGVKHTFEIPQEIYEALKPNYDSNSKITIKPLNAFSNFKRNVLTQYNPFFMVTNMIKDAQDVLINSQHPATTYKAIPEAIAQLSSKGYWYKEMQAQGLFQDTYYDNQGGFDTTKKGIEKLSEFYPLKKIAEVNDFIERVPRMAEYIASRKAGRSVEVASLDASRVTTNFKAGGDWTKFFNRNGATFLNASIQGAVQQVRNVQEAHQKGLKGYMGLATKFTVAALPAILLNNLLWDDDDEYEELSDYIKDNYYIIGKYGDGQFIRIPKGRMTAVIQKTIGEMQNLITGDDEVDLGNYLELVANNLAPSNPIENNIFSPFINTKLFNKDDAGTTWYGEDLVPTRLQSKPVKEQYDETTDEFSKWLGEKLNLSPIKINNLIDQNTGVIGDLLLPMMTAEAKTKNDNPIAAGIEDKFTADVVFDNKYSTDFYSVKEDLAKKSNSYEATDEDILKTKYMNSKQAQMNDIYAEIREVQNSDLDKKTKYAQVRDLRKQLNDIAETSLDSYSKLNIESSYAKVGEIEFRKNDSGEWQKITSKQLEKQNEAINTLGVSANNYWENKDEYDYAIDNPDKYKVISQIDTYDNYLSYKNDIADIKEQYEGYSTKQRKAAVQDYIESLNLSVPKKIMLEKMAGGYSIKDYEGYMFGHIESLPMSAKEKQELHKQLFD